MHIFWGRVEYLEHLMVCSTPKAKQQPRGYHLINFAIVAELLKFIVTYKLPKKFSFKPFDYFYDQKIYIIRRANARIVRFSSLYGGQFTLSTKLLTSNYPVMAPPPRQHQSFFRNLPPFIRSNLDWLDKFISFLICFLSSLVCHWKLSHHYRWTRKGNINIWWLWTGVGDITVRNQQ